MINPKWLRTYITLVEEGHFTRTAEKLFMTQPGVSQHVAKLEQTCNTVLLIREGKKFELTDAGEKLYHYAKQHLDSESEFLQNIAGVNPDQGVIKIACSGALTQQLYPLCLQLQTQRPLLNFEFESCSNTGAMNRVLDGSSGIALVTQRPTHALLEQQKIGEQQLSLVLPESAKGHGIDLAYLDSLGLVSHPDALHFLSLYRHNPQKNLLSDIDLTQVRTVSYVNQLEQILAPIAHGIGFTVLPSSCVELSPYKDKLDVHHDKVNIVESVYLVNKVSKPLPAHYQHAVTLCRQALSSRPD